MTQPRARSPLTFVLGLGLFTALPACSNAADAESGPPCDVNADCGSDMVCLYVDGAAACAPICTGQVDACGASASCGGVGVLDVDVCQPVEEDPDPMDPPEPAEEPRIPCATDAECAELGAGAVCAEWMGQRDCTMTCTSESQCTPPTIGGVTVDFLTCLTDAADSSRQVCVPDIACFDDPLMCIDFGGIDTGFDAGTESGFDTGFDTGFETGG